MNAYELYTQYDRALYARSYIKDIVPPDLRAHLQTWIDSLKDAWEFVIYLQYQGVQVGDTVRYSVKDVERQKQYAPLRCTGTVKRFVAVLHDPHMIRVLVEIPDRDVPLVTLFPADIDEIISKGVENESLSK